MFLKTLLSGIFLFVISLMCFGQTSRDVAPPPTAKPQYQAEKVKKKKGIFDQIFQKKPKTPVEEFRSRMRQVSKEKAKEEKLAERPQYSDPLYFGHKKLPKKRPVGKQKFCKECHIRH